MTDGCPLRGMLVKNALRQRHRRGLLIPVFCLLSSVLYPLNAEELPDPTRPPVSLAAQVAAPASGVDATPATGLQSIIISRTRRAAIIGGETVELGGNYGDARLVEVNDTGIVLTSKQGRQVLTLFPDVKMIDGGEMKPQPAANKMRAGKQENRPVAR